MITTTVYFYEFEWENGYLIDTIRSYYDLDSSVNIDTSCFEVNDSETVISPSPVYVEHFYNTPKEELKEMIREKIFDEFGFYMSEDEYWYE